MNITYHGYTCFKIQSSNKATIITDIFDKSIGLRPQAPKADILTYSCDHYDSKDALKGKRSKDEVAPFVIKGSGEYEISGIMVNGVEAKHGGKLAKDLFNTTIYVFYVDGIKICHLGDIGQKEVTEEQLNVIGDVDILMVPVGGEYVSDYKEAAHIVHQIEPRIIIPMAYDVKGLNIKLDKVDLFLKEIGLDPKEKVEKFKILKQDLPQGDMEAVVFDM